MSKSNVYREKLFDDSPTKYELLPFFLDTQ
jgi:hypothetical protein